MTTIYSLLYNDYTWLDDNTDFKCVFARNDYKIPPKDSIMLFHGGEDIDPIYYNQPKHQETRATNPKRDKFENEALDYCIQNKIPIIGICRGAQWLCIKAGGILNQHVPAHKNNNHYVTTQYGTFISKGDHHQVMIPDNTNHKLIGYSTEDDIPEIVYFYDINGLAIQFHPEWMNKNHVFNTDIFPKLIKDYLQP